MTNGLRISIAIIGILVSSIPLPAQWKQTRGPSGAAVEALVEFDSLLYAGTMGGGIFRLAQNETSWTAVNEGLTTLMIRSLTVADTIMFAATWGEGVFRSTNGGSAWTYVGLTGNDINAIASVGTEIVAGTESGNVFLSTNQGGNWTQITNGLPATGTNAVYALTSSGSNLFAGTWLGVYCSTNNGTSWTQVNNGLASSAVIALAVSGDGSGKLFAGTYGGGVYSSSNNGADWTGLNDSLLDMYVLSLTWFDSALYAGTGHGVFRLPDDGISWVPINNGLTTPVVSFFAGQSALFAGTGDWENGGVFRSTDKGATWVAIIDGLAGTRVLALAVDPSSSSDVYAGMLGRGVSVTSDGGEHWIARNTGLANTYVNALAFHGTVLLAGTSVGIFRSSDQGQTWNSAGGTSQFARCFASSSDGMIGGELFAGADGVFRSSDDGMSWHAASNGLPRFRLPWDTSQFLGVYALAWRDSTLFAGTNGGGVYRTTDSGATWSAANVGLTNAAILSLASLGGNLFAGTIRGVFRSTDNGDRWDSTGHLTHDVTSFAVVGSSLFAATDHGVFLSETNGSTWTDAGAGLPDMTVLALAVSGTDLFAATGGGVWRRPLSEMITGVDSKQRDRPSEFVLDQNYPNPFNPVTTIGFDLPSRSFVSLRIIDILGREIALLVSGDLPQGKHSVTWNAEKASSGVYLYELRSGRSREVKRLMVIK